MNIQSRRVSIRCTKPSRDGSDFVAARKAGAKSNGKIIKSRSFSCAEAKLEFPAAG